MIKKTYLDFGEAMDELRKKSGVSFDTMSFKLGIAQSYLWGLANRRKANLPKDDLMIKIANYFHITPEYFFEWRLKRMLENINKEREFLDHCEKEFNKWIKKETLEKQKEAYTSLSAESNKIA
jgi:transcriptional regulator with XRE-family HTH domain